MPELIIGRAVDVVIPPPDTIGFALIVTPGAFGLDWPGDDG